MLRIETTFNWTLPRDVTSVDHRSAREAFTYAEVDSGVTESNASKRRAETCCIIVKRHISRALYLVSRTLDVLPHSIACFASLSS